MGKAWGNQKKREKKEKKVAKLELGRMLLCVAEFKFNRSSCKQTKKAKFELELFFPKF
jgi:hypothetical protein